MAKIRAFEGLRYDLSKAKHPGDLLAPPYDVIDEQQRAELAAASPYNCVHVILPVAAPGDDAPLAKYRAGAEAFRKLQKLSWDRNQKLAQVARIIIEGDELMTTVG